MKVYRCPTHPGITIRRDISFRGGFFTATDESAVEYIDNHPWTKDGRIQVVAEAEPEGGELPDPRHPISKPLIKMTHAEMIEVCSELGIKPAKHRATTMSLLSDRVRVKTKTEITPPERPGADLSALEADFD